MQFASFWKMISYGLFIFGQPWCMVSLSASLQIFYSSLESQAKFDHLGQKLPVGFPHGTQLRFRNCSNTQAATRMFPKTRISPNHPCRIFLQYTCTFLRRAYSWTEGYWIVVADLWPIPMQCPSTTTTFKDVICTVPYMHRCDILCSTVSSYLCHNALWCTMYGYCILCDYEWLYFYIYIAVICTYIYIYS